MTADSSAFPRPVSAAADTPAAAAPSGASPALPDPDTTRVQDLGWMQGFPPPDDKRITFQNSKSMGFPQLRWRLSHMRELVPTVNVWRGAGPASPLPTQPQDLDAVPVTLATGEQIDFAEAMRRTYADGIAVLHRGQLVHERYWGELRPERPHMAFSVTKSVVGLLAATLMVEGQLDPNALVPHHLPELGQGAYATATLRQVMDMTIGVRYSEDYTRRDAEVNAYARAAGMSPRAPSYTGPGTLYEFLQQLQPEGEHGQAFAYKTVNTEVLAWVLRRITGLSLAELVSQRLWQPMGAEQDAYFTVDPIGTESAGGGLNLTLRDLLRLGELMRLGGRVGNRQVIPEAAVADVLRGGEVAHFAKAGFATLPGWSYRNMWWVSHNAHGSVMARGIHGQSLYVAPKAEVVIARFAGHPVASNVGNDPITQPAFLAVANALMQRG